VQRRGRPGARRRRLAIRTDAAIRSGRLVGVDNSPLTGEVQHRKRLAQNPLHDRPDQKKVATLLVQPSARSDELDQPLWAEVTRHLQHPDLILKACRAPREEFPAHQDRQLAELRGPQRRLLDAYQSGAISLPELEARRRPLDDRVRELEQSAQSAQRRSHTKAQLQQQLTTFPTKLPAVSALWTSQNANGSCDECSKKSWSRRAQVQNPAACYSQGGPKSTVTRKRTIAFLT